MQASVAAILGVALLLSGCSRDIQSKEAVRSGILSHLSNRAGLDVGSMDVEVTSVSFRGAEADATVSFRPKGSSDPASGMQMLYTLERKGNQWIVKGKRESGSTPHSGAPEAPPGHTGQLPPGHPPAGGKDSPGKQ